VRDSTQSFAFGSTIPFQNGILFQSLLTTGIYGTLSSIGEVFFNADTDVFMVSEPIEITESTVRGKDWELSLHQGFSVQKFSKNRYEIKKIAE
jgi:hypothetical protein